MEKSNGVGLEITGTFSFSIDQQGLNYYDKEELECAIKDFWNEFEKSQETHPDNVSIGFDWDEKDLEIYPT